MEKHRTLVVGELGSAAGRALEAVASTAGLDVVLAADVSAGLVALGAAPVASVVVEAQTDGAERLCRAIRGRHDLGRVPVIVASRAISEVVYVKAFRWGADGVVMRRGVVDVVQRLSQLPKVEGGAGPKRGVAVVADDDSARCNVIGRVLTNAGFEVQYGVDERSARYYLDQPGVRLAVFGTGVGDLEALYGATQAAREALWVVAAKPPELKRLAPFVEGRPNVVATSVFAPPEDVLFHANEAAAGDAVRQRGSQRVLHGATVTFRARGSTTDEYGFTYNVSVGGMFVRTLAPPDADLLWIDVRPPHADRVVRLLGEVRWRRPFGPAGGASAPPGFAVRFVDGLGDDLELWAEHCKRLVEDRSARGGAVAAVAAEAGDGRARIASLIDEQVSSGRGEAPSVAGGADEPVTPGGAEPYADAAPTALEETPVSAALSAENEPTEDSVSGSTSSVRDPPTRFRSGAVWLAAVALVTAVGAAGLVLGLEPGLVGGDTSGTTSIAPVAPPPRAARPPTAGANRPVPQPPVEPPSEAAPLAPAEERALPSSAAAPLPGPDGPPAVVAPSAADLLGLPATEGYLYVESPVNEPVSVHGVISGDTNAWMKVRCGSRFLRLGSPDKWITSGRVDVVACRAATRMVMLPDAR